MEIISDFEEFLTSEDHGVELIPVELISLTNPEKIKKKTKPIIQTDGQISIEEFFKKNDSGRFNLLNDDEPIGITSTGLPLYRNDDQYSIKETGRITEKKLQLLDLRDRQFLRIEEIKKEMKENGEKRHLFLIKHGTLISSYDNSRGKFFKGCLSQEVLAVINGNHLEMIPLIPEDKIIINFFDPRMGQRFRKEIHDYRIIHGGVDCVDLSKIKNSRDLFIALTPKK